MPELEHLRKFAATASRAGFGVGFFKQDGNTGEFHRTGKANANANAMNHEKWAGDPLDAMLGHRKFENKISTYHIGRVADGFRPAEREQLGDLDERLWPKGKDPWEEIYLLPFWNVETREILLFSATNGGSRSAVANLVGAYLNNVEVHPEDLHRVPLIELESDSYISKHGKQIFYPVFSILSWIDRPASVRRILPPPATLELRALPAPASPPAPAPTPTKSDKRTPAVAKAKTKKSTVDDVGSKPIDFDDEVPFAPEWRG
jgi:hypothetical protein